MRVAIGVYEALLCEARSAHPREACGLLFGTAGAITALQAASNVHPTPNTHFEIDPQALVDAHRAMRGGGRQLVGYYHSHPRGPAQPSATDQAVAARDGMIWAIVGEGQVTLWRAAAAGLEPLPYRAASA